MFKRFFVDVLTAPFLLPWYLVTSTREDTSLLCYVTTKSSNPYLVRSLISFLGINDFSTRNQVGDTALHCAVKQGHVEVVQVLLGLGADIDARNQAGDTALHCAVKQGYVEVVRVLLGSGADIDARNQVGDTALHCAAKQGHIEIVKMLLMHRFRDYLSACISIGIPQTTTHIVKHMFSEKVNTKNQSGDTALDCAKKQGHVRVIKELQEALKLDGSANVNTKSRTGETILSVGVGPSSNTSYYPSYFTGYCEKHPFSFKVKPANAPMPFPTAVINVPSFLQIKTGRP